MAAPASPAEIVVITGAAGGIGYAAALRLGRRCPLFIADLDAARLEDAAQRLRAAAIDVSAVVCDVRDAGAVQALAHAVGARGSVMTLVHAAGISPSMGDARNILDINYFGTARVLAAFLPILSTGSAAVCIASMAAYRTGLAEFDPLLRSAEPANLMDSLLLAARNQSSAAYGLSKRGIIRMVEYQSRAWAKQGVRLVSLSPGVVDTPMGRLEAGSSGAGNAPLALQTTALGRFARADEIAAAAEFLGSSAAGYITGCDLLIDGGAVAGFSHHSEEAVRQAWNSPWR
jgi:NAD(P)-dependent dehydrogenase (short-subunit alcohol dehydrogenase family)